MENWKHIEGFGEYEVSSLGRVRRGEKILKISSRRDTGYGYLGLTRDDGTKTYPYIHRLVGRAFLPNPDNKPTINHIDRNTSNNRLDNLEWATYLEQTHHSPKATTAASGHRCIKVRCDSYQVVTEKNYIVFRKTFSTLQEAIEARDEFLATLS